MKKIYTSLLLTVAFCLGAQAQTTPFSSYFVDNYAFKYRLNPSLLSEKSFLSAGIGNLNFGLQSGIGINSFIFPTEDGLVTGLNKSISPSAFLDPIPDAMALRFNTNINAFALGIRTNHSLWTFEVNTRGDIMASLPKGLLEFMKLGSKDDPFDLSNLHVGANVLAEVALGNGICLNRNWTIGWRAKLLVGVAGVQSDFKTASLTANGSTIAIDADGALRAACPINVGTDDKGILDFESIAIDPATIKENLNWGGAIDLGVTWEPFRYFKLSAGITDLGLMKWNYNLNAVAVCNASFSGFENLSADSIKKEFENMGETLKDIYKFKIEDDVVSRTELLPFTANLGVKYRIPFLRMISLGGFANYHYDKFTPFFDLRAGATLTPLQWLSVSANYGTSTFGPVCGSAFSITLLGLNIFTAIDAYAGGLSVIPVEALASQGIDGFPIPVGPFRYNMTFGMTIQFGKRHNDVRHSLWN